jgi:CheY-like chemotaxis protein
MLRRACPEPVTLALSLSAAPAAANVDAAQFKAALLNLVVNAKDAMPQGGTVEIATGSAMIGAARAQAMSDISPGDYVTVAVRDGGEGMPAGVQARAFEPFFTTREIGKGSGLGLSQVYGFVMQSGGHVAIDSAPGAGSTLTLYLPAASCQPTTDKTERHAPAGRVLVVEDDPEVLEVTVESLRHIGYEVLTAADGPSALAVLGRDDPIDILFSDVAMPRGMNGVELARAALRLRPGLRVLLASGYPIAALTATQDAPPGGEFPFLSKPYRGSELAAALRALHPEA